MNSKIISELNILIDYYKNILSKQSYSNKDKYIYKINAINNGINIIKTFNKDLSKQSNIKLLNNKKGIGKGIISRINEINKLGYLKETQRYKNKLIKQSQLYNVYGLGYKTISILNDNQIYTINDLKNAIKTNKFSPTKSILLGIKYYNIFKEHIDRDEMNLHNKLLSTVIKSINKNIIIEVCGSYRRGNDYSNDIDCVVTHKTTNYLKDIVDKLKEIKYIVDEITDSYTYKVMAFCASIDTSTTKLKYNIIRRLDILYVPYDEYITSLFYFTGDKYFNQHIRSIAKNKGYKLNEHGLYKINSNNTLSKVKNIKSEHDIFKYIKEKYIQPKNRQYKLYL